MSIIGGLAINIALIYLILLRDISFMMQEVIVVKPTVSRITQAILPENMTAASAPNSKKSI